MAAASRRCEYSCPCDPGRRHLLCDLFLCGFCTDNVVRCPLCVVEDIEASFCANCLENMPSAEAVQFGNRCSKCLECPECGTTLSIVATAEESSRWGDGDAAEDAAVLYSLLCPHCRWRSGREHHGKCHSATELHEALARREAEAENQEEQIRQRRRLQQKWEKEQGQEQQQRGEVEGDDEDEDEDEEDNDVPLPGSGLSFAPDVSFARIRDAHLSAVESRAVELTKERQRTANQAALARATGADESANSANPGNSGVPRSLQGQGSARGGRGAFCGGIDELEAHRARVEESLGFTGPLPAGRGSPFFIAADRAACGFDCGNADDNNDDDEAGRIAQVLRAASLEEDESGVCTATTLSQRFTDLWRHPRSARAVLPRRKPLMTKRSRRCGECLRIIVKPELNASSTLFPKFLVAMDLFPVFTARWEDSRRTRVVLRAVNPSTFSSWISLSQSPVYPSTVGDVVMPEGEVEIDEFSEVEAQDDLVHLCKEGDPDCVVDRAANMVSIAMKALAAGGEGINAELGIRCALRYTNEVGGAASLTFDAVLPVLPPRPQK